MFEQGFAEEVRVHQKAKQGTVLQKGNSMCRDLSVHSPTPFTGDIDPTGNSPGFKTLMNKKNAYQITIHFFGRNVILCDLPENSSPGCKHTIRFLSPEGF